MSCWTRPTPRRGSSSQASSIPARVPKSYTDSVARGWAEGLTYDSVVANASASQVHRELIVYDHRQAYPEYLVRFTD